MNAGVISLYNLGRPIREISRNLKIDRNKVRKILKSNNIKIRSSRDSLISSGLIKEKNRFNLDSKEKAYLFGLVMGDLTPFKKSNYTLRLVTNSTHFTFMKLLERTFSRYTSMTRIMNNKQGDLQFQADLDFESFSFLLETKKGIIPEWVNKDNLFDFLAGFVDSDGSVMIKHSYKYFQHVIRFCGENFGLLNSIKSRLMEIGYYASLSLSAEKGEIRYYKNKLISYNQNYYILDVSQKEKVVELLRLLPIRHPEKILKKDLIFYIEKMRFKYWDDVKELVKSLKELIRESVESRKDLN